MPMRGELVIPASPSRADFAIPATRSRSEWELSDRSIWAVICFCLIGLLVTFGFALSVIGLDQLPVIMAQYNLFG